MVEKKFNEIEKHWMDKLKKIPRLPELKNRYVIWFSKSQVQDWEVEARIIKLGGTVLFSTTRMGRRWHMDGIEFRYDKSGKVIFMTYENTRYHLTDKEKEWVVLNYENILKPKLTVQYDDMLEMVAKKMEQTEAKMFTAMSVKV